MTEAEWLACGDPQRMLVFLRGKVSDRKLRLFACACCRRIWHHLKERPSRRIVEVSEQYADDLATQKRLKSAQQKADDAFMEVHLAGGGDLDQNPAQAVVHLGDPLEVSDAIEMAAETFGAVARGEAYERIWKTPGKESEARWAEDDAVRRAASSEEERVQANLLREVVGNPFRPVIIDPMWLAWADGTVAKLARVIYDERAFDRLPILADALTDAGCGDETLLSHLRSPGPHVRGCWAVDLALGKN